MNQTEKGLRRKFKRGFWKRFNIRTPPGSERDIYFNAFARKLKMELETLDLILGGPDAQWSKLK